MFNLILEVYLLMELFYGQQFNYKQYLYDQIIYIRETCFSYKCDNRVENGLERRSI